MNSLRKDLNIIEKLLQGPNGQQLWNVLTALRGPDYGNDAHKDATVGIIRRVAFPNLFVRGSAHGAVAYDDYKAAVKVRSKLSKLVLDRKSTKYQRYLHFYRHVMWAFEALKLNWNNVNNMEPQDEQPVPSK